MPAATSRIALLPESRTDPLVTAPFDAHENKPPIHPYSALHCSSSSRSGGIALALATAPDGCLSLRITSLCTMLVMLVMLVDSSLPALAEALAEGALLALALLVVELVGRESHRQRSSAMHPSLVAASSSGFSSSFYWLPAGRTLPSKSESSSPLLPPPRAPPSPIAEARTGSHATAVTADRTRAPASLAAPTLPRAPVRVPTPTPRPRAQPMAHTSLGLRPTGTRCWYQRLPTAALASPLSPSPADSLVTPGGR